MRSQSKISLGVALICAIALVPLGALGSPQMRPDQPALERGCCAKADELAKAVQDQTKLIEVLEKEVKLLKEQHAACGAALTDCKKRSPGNASDDRSHGAR
jgi:hypothetical protein